jgi:arabinofuranan 3-O-arabinosyltransferase
VARASCTPANSCDARRGDRSRLVCPVALGTGVERGKGVRTSTRTQPWPSVADRSVQGGAARVAPKAARLIRVLVYLIPAIAVGAAVQSWFVSGKFIAEGDVGPFLRQDVAAEFTSAWGHDSTGAGAPSFQIVRIPELAALSLTEALGASAHAAQRVYYTVVAGAAAIGTVFFSRALTHSPVANIGSGLLAIFNPFVLQQVPNLLPIWAVALMAVLGGMLLRSAQGHRVTPLRLALATTGASFLSLNPPLLVAAVLLVPALVIVCGVGLGFSKARTMLRVILLATPWVLLLNAWWLVPHVQSIMTLLTNGMVAAETSIKDWAWTHSRSSLPNVLSLNAGWAWAYDEYFPYAYRLDQPPWAYLRFGLPAVSFLAPFLVHPRRRRWAGAFVLTLVVILFLSKGIHPPFAFSNLWLYEHVPGMWLFREPAAKLGPLHLLLYIALTSMVLDHVSRRDGAKRGFKTAVVVSCVAATMLYCFPLVTGEVIPDTRPQLPPAHVEIPRDWYRIANLVNSERLRGKVLILPLNRFYQIGTSWGYYGVDTVPRSILTRPTIQLMPGGYIADPPHFRRLVKAVQRKLSSGRTRRLGRTLRSLGVSHIILRKDLARRSLTSQHIVGSIKTTLTGLAGIFHLATTSVADVFRLGEDSVVTINSVGTCRASLRRNSTCRAASPLPVEAHWQQLSPTQYTVQVPPTSQAFVISLQETYDDKWSLEGIPSPRGGTHFRNHGYANGWLVSPGSSLDLEITYRGQHNARLGYSVSALAALAAFALAFGKWLGNRLGTRATTDIGT